LIYKQIYKKIIFLNKLSEEQKILFVYRYASLLITSLFYFTSEINHSTERKLFIMFCIGASSAILNYLYIKKKDDATIINLLVFIETMGNSIILIPSGGLSSPYVWYALNTILIAAVMLERKYCWLNLLAYMISTTWITHYIFNEKQQKLTELIKQQSNLIISFILITIAILLLSRYIKEIKRERIKLIRTNKELMFANHQVKESVNHIIELYQSVQLFSSLRNKNDLITMILEHTKNITKSDVAMFYDFSQCEKKVIVDTNRSTVELEDALKTKILEVWDEIIYTSNPMEIYVENKSYLFISVKSNYMTYGILGIENTEYKERFESIESIDQLKFFSELSAIALEKFELEQINEQLLISGEQNRIANEIHDSILQRLFSTSFGIYGLMKRLNKITINDINDELNIIRGAIDRSMKDLRSAIYGLSWKKGGADNFVVDTVNYVNEIRTLNNVEIDFNILGNSEFLSIMQKNCLYRIICEGIGNAVRHGKASHIEATLHIGIGEVSLEIVDDGIGFDLNTTKEQKREGLGIKNMHYLVHSLKGKIDYQSTIEKGTKITITIPEHAQDLREEKAV